VLAGDYILPGRPAEQEKYVEGNCCDGEPYIELSVQRDVDPQQSQKYGHCRKMLKNEELL
jgi:hypothetical protein